MSTLSWVSMSVQQKSTEAYQVSKNSNESDIKTFFIQNKLQITVGHQLFVTTVIQLLEKQMVEYLKEKLKNIRLTHQLTK